MRFKTLFLAGSIAALGACQGWQAAPTPAPGGSLEGNPEVVRVTRTIGCGPTPSRSCVASRGTITLYNPRIQGDSLIGYYDKENRERVAVSVSDITNVEAQKVDKLRTTGAVLGGTGILLGALAVLLLIAALSAVGGG